MDAQKFVAAALPWLTSLDENGAKEVIDRLNRSLYLTSPKLKIAFRPDEVLTALHKQVAVAAEPLTRWDGRDPTEIFRDGFRPTLATSSLARFRNLNNDQVNISSFVVNETPSIFVSTTRYARCGDNLAHWTPSNSTDQYEYEIFAYGGVDVNISLRLENHPSASQQEVAFPGGIRPGLIRSARQYDDSGRTVVRVWRNLGFNPLLNGENAPHVIDLPPLPNLVDAANFIVIDPSTNSGGVNGNMKDYRLKVDPWVAHDVPALPVACASVLHSKADVSKCYFFADTRFVTINLDTKHGLKDTIGPGGVQNIVDTWPALRKAKFTQVDAVLPNPDNNDEAHFFYGKKCIRVNLKTKEAIVDPMEIGAAFPSLRKAGFTTIDAALPNYDNNGEAYIFSGKNYVRIKINSSSDATLSGLKVISAGWKSLEKAGFDTVDAALVSPHEKGQTYFIKGDKYVRISFVWAKKSDKLETDPPKAIKDGWPSLVQAKFY